MDYCILVPTYNNDRTLELVLEQVLKITHDIIVVNDGSTDNTIEILKKYQEIMKLLDEKFNCSF
ncbi:MAG: glycosyltransferase [Bacteroidales bacterium]|nr:glycosyltransferase [Bacteroidales bacterium]